MRFKVLMPCTLGLVLVCAPAFSIAQSAAVQAPHVWVTSANAKHELSPAQVQVAKAEQSGTHGSAASSMLQTVGATALSAAIGPIGAVASSVFNLFGHHPSPRPSFKAVLALAGQHASDELSTNSPSFDLSYADTPGLDPDAYAPAILKLAVTKDNWRVVSVSNSSDPSALSAMMMPAGMPSIAASGSGAIPELTEDRVPGASVVMLGRGHAQITLSQPLQPGEYGIVLRPVASAKSDASQNVLRTVWDFSIPAQTTQHQ